MQLQAGITPQSHLGTSLNPTLASEIKFYDRHRPLSYGEQVYRALYDTTDTYSDRDAAFRRFRPVMVGMNLESVPSLGFSGNATTFSASLPGSEPAPPPPGNPVYFTQPYADAMQKPDLWSQAAQTAAKFTPAYETRPPSYMDWNPPKDDRFQEAGVDGQRYTEMLPSLAITGARPQDEVLFKPADAKPRNEHGFMTTGRQVSEYERTLKRKAALYADMYKDDQQLAAIEAIADAVTPVVQPSPMQTFVPPVFRFQKPEFPPALPSKIVFQDTSVNDPQSSQVVQTPISWYIPAQVGEMSLPGNVAAVKSSFHRTRILAETFPDQHVAVITKLQLVPGEIVKPQLKNCIRYIFDKEYRRKHKEYSFWEMNATFVVMFVMLLIIVALLISVIIVGCQKDKYRKIILKKEQ